MRKKTTPTRVIKQPEKTVIDKKSTTLYHTDGGIFRLVDLVAVLAEAGIVINKATLYGRLRKDWANPENFSQEEIIYGNGRREREHLFVGRPERNPESIKIGTWEMAQL